MKLTKKRVAELLRSKKKFQEWAIETYIKNYYASKDISFIKINRPKNIHPDIKGIPLINFDAEYYDSFNKTRWKINFLLTNNCVRQILKEMK